MNEKEYFSIIGFRHFACINNRQRWVVGPLANFDVVNDTGKTAQGFEIEMDGIQQNDITSLFGAAICWVGMERYDIPTVTTTATGVKVTYQSVPAGSKWKAGATALPQGGSIPAPYDSCWSLSAIGFVPTGGTIYDSTYPATTLVFQPIKLKLKPPIAGWWRYPQTLPMAWLYKRLSCRTRL